MEIFPAIDLKNGEVVRLTQGDYNKVDVYSKDPSAIAVGFARQGAKNLHVVDLDGARDGETVNFDAVRNLVKQKDLFVQVGGGIRDEERICRYLDLGVGRVILGTAALENPAFAREMILKYGEKIAVGVDARDGKVAVRGWREISSADSMDFCRELAEIGVATIIYTDIARDGAMLGTNLDIYRELSLKVNTNIIASGGVSTMNDVQSLIELGVYGAILGKALYTGALDLSEVLKIC